MADQKINGALYRSMVIEGALAIAEKKEQANELNVFPVPDGDTGTNMSMTMGSAMAEMEKLAEPTLAKAADATASALLRLSLIHILFLSLAQTRDRRPLRKKDTAEDFSSHKDGPTSGPSFSFTYSQFGYCTATHTVQSTLSAA